MGSASGSFDLLNAISGFQTTTGFLCKAFFAPNAKIGFMYLGGDRGFFFSPLDAGQDLHASSIPVQHVGVNAGASAPHDGLEPGHKIKGHGNGAGSAPRHQSNANKTSRIVNSLLMRRLRAPSSRRRRRRVLSSFMPNSECELKHEKLRRRLSRHLHVP